MPPREEQPMDRQVSRLSRRGFVAGTAGLGLLAGCGRLPWPGRERQPGPPPRIGFLSPSPAQAAQSYVEAFEEGLREHGYRDGQNITIDYRFAEGRDDRVGDLAAELVGLDVRVIVTEGGPAAYAAKQVTSTIPVVFALAADPVGTGLVASIPRPGENVTGLTTFSPELAGKRLELLKQVVPAMSRVAVLWNATSADKQREFGETEAAARALGIQVQSLALQGAEALDGAFERAARADASALATLGDPLTVNQRAHIVELAARSLLPAIYPLKLFVDVGGLMSYGPSIAGNFRRAAYYVDRILKGTSPADLPVEQPMTFDFVVNLKTAQALGITFPNEIMLQVTEVLE
jgi:putative tryptophan/tyrosine transport system substrate-binding protein